MRIELRLDFKAGLDILFIWPFNNFLEYILHARHGSRYWIVVVQSLSHVWLFATPWTAACQASVSLTISRSSPRFTFIDWWCHPTISSSTAPFSFCLLHFPLKWPKCKIQQKKILKFYNGSYGTYALINKLRIALMNSAKINYVPVH